MNKGKSIRLFLHNGDYNGIISAELVNWTGQVISCPRSMLKDLISRDECRDKPGIYMLIGTAYNEFDHKVYLGETDSLSDRLPHHASSGKMGKDFWDRVIVVSSKDSNLTKSHVKYLESRLIDIAREIGNCTLLNGKESSKPTLPDSDMSDMEFFIDQLRNVLPSLGFNFLRGSSSLEKIEDVEVSNFVIESKKYGIKAYATEIGSDFVVKEGSGAISWFQESKTSDGYKNLQKRLIEDGILIKSDNDFLVFAKDFIFKSPSAAASVVLGRSANGRVEWKK